MSPILFLAGAALLFLLVVAGQLKMSAHRIPFDDAYAAWGEADPGSGKPFVSSGRQAMSVVPLQIGSGAETNTLPDPERVGLMLTLTVYSRAGGTRAVTAASVINVSGNHTMTFSLANHSVMLMSVPFSGNANKARWEIVYNDGPALS